jgi:hypothetical protein
MGTAAGAPQRLTKLYLGNCTRTEEAGSRSRRKWKDSHDLLEVVGELESVTEHSGTVTWCVVSRSPSRTWPRNSRALKELTLMSAICSCL